MNMYRLAMSKNKLCLKNSHTYYFINHSKHTYFMQWVLGLQAIYVYLCYGVSYGFRYLRNVFVINNTKLKL